MKYLETKHERNSAKITALLLLILLLLLFVVGPPYMDPPEEYGVAVNFGNSNTGSGDVQPDKPVKSQNNTINKPPEEAQSQPEQAETQPSASASNAQAEEVLTQDSEEAIAIKKQKAAEQAQAKKEADAKAEADKIAKAKAAAEAKKKQEEADKIAKLKALIGGLNNSEGEASGSEGDDKQAGDKGQLNGEPYAPYKGIPGNGNGGVGYGLNGRGKAKFKVLEGCENEYGLVVVSIVVNRNGEVIEATPGVKGTTNTNACLKEVAKRMALSHKWDKDQNAPARQFGTVSISFTPD